MTEDREVQGGKVTLQWFVRRRIYMRSCTETSTHCTGKQSKVKRHVRAVKQYLTRKEWKEGEQSCSLEELQKRTHRAKKGLGEREKEREAKERLGIGKTRETSQHSCFIV